MSSLDRASFVVISAVFKSEIRQIFIEIQTFIEDHTKATHWGIPTFFLADLVADILLLTLPSAGKSDGSSPASFVYISLSRRRPSAGFRYGSWSSKRQIAPANTRGMPQLEECVVCTLRTSEIPLRWFWWFLAEPESSHFTKNLHAFYRNQKKIGSA